MLKIQKLKLLIVLLGSLLIVSASVAPSIITAPKVYAADCTQQLKGDESKEQVEAYKEQCGCRSENITKDNCGIVQYLIKIINVLSAVVGIVIVIMIAIGGIQYSAARDNPQAAVAARTKIYNAVLALVVFLFTYSFLQWIVPGGIFR